jgi:hypothetical protein
MSDSVKKYYEVLEDKWHTTTSRDEVLNQKRDTIVEEVKDIFDKRSQQGIKEYGTTLADNPDGFWRWINELQTELMDAVLYIQKLKKSK